MEPPNSICTVSAPGRQTRGGHSILGEDELPWIDAGPGLLQRDVDLRLPPIPEGCFLHHFLTCEVWQTFYICGRDVRLEWLEPQPVPSQSGRRAAFPGESI